jgi:hypothetical protein
MDHVVEISDSQYVTKNSTDITWIFPKDMIVKWANYHAAQIKTDFYSQQYIPMTLSRTMNKTQFSGDGYQKASFSVLFENKTYAYQEKLCDEIFTGISTGQNLKNLNATLLLDTFSTDAPGHVYAYNTYRSCAFEWNVSEISLNRAYNFSIVIRVVPNGTSPVVFKPYFGVVLFNNTYRGFRITWNNLDLLADLSGFRVISREILHNYH